MTEKIALAPVVMQLAERQGTSFQLFHGQPKLLDTERLASLLAPRVQRPVRVLALVDDDDSGWIIARAFADQLRMNHLEVSSIDFLCTPDRFSTEELTALSCPIAARRQQSTKLNAWLRESVGIDGQARGIHANHLLPFERVERIFLEILDR